mgnify:CR=1 FL=1
MQYSISIYVEGDEEITLEQVVALADAVAKHNGIASGAGAMGYGVQIAVEAEDELQARQKAIELFGMIEKFAGYGFNKSHSTAYGAVAYQTAYLKAHYPPEFMAALLSCELGETDKLIEHVEDCRRMGIEILPPNVNQGDVEFSVLGDKLTFGLGAIKGVGESAIGAIVAERTNNGPFKSIFDLAERCDPKTITKGVLELLIKAGACDCLGGKRSQLFVVVERAVQSASNAFRDKQRGQRNLFGGDDDEELPKAGIAAAPTKPSTGTVTR